MTKDQSNALWCAEQAAQKALDRHDEVRKRYLKALFGRGTLEDQARIREELREARLVLDCTGIALVNARKNARVEVH